MQLSFLIDEYRACEKALYKAIRAEKVATIREYDIRMNWLRNVIRDFFAANIDDRLRQIDFFIESISQASDISPGSALFSDARTIIERYLTDMPMKDMPGDGETIDKVRANGPDLVRAPDRRRDIIDMIERTDLRISTFDPEFRYVYTSPANSRFYNIPQHAFSGRHITEMIGEDRFEKRAKFYFDKCMAGEDQCYYYYLYSEKRGRQLLECRMVRQYDAHDETLGAVIIMRDLTDGFDDPLRSAEENRI